MRMANDITFNDFIEFLFIKYFTFPNMLYSLTNLGALTLSLNLTLIVELEWVGTVDTMYKIICMYIGSKYRLMFGRSRAIKQTLYGDTFCIHLF